MPFLAVRLSSVSSVRLMGPALTILTMCVALAGCAGLRLSGSFRSADDDWTMQGGTTDRHHRVVNLPELPWTRLWEYNAQGGILASPLVRDSIAIIATLHGEIQAVDLGNGKRLGYEKLGSPIRGTPALNGVTIIVPLSTGNGSVVAFDLRENRKLWQATVGPVEGGILLDGANVYVASLEGHVVCLDVRTGEERWRFSIGTRADRKPLRTTPALEGTTLVVGSDDGSLVGLDAQSGTQRWRCSSSASFFAGPVIVNGIAVAGDVRGHVLGVDVATGTVLWRRDAGAAIYGGAATDGTRVYLPTAAGCLLALDAATGNVRWSYAGSSVMNSAPLVAGDRILVGSLDRSVSVVNATTGALVDKIVVEGRMKVTPVVWRGMVLLTYEDKYVAAYVHAGGGS